MRLSHPIEIKQIIQSFDSSAKVYLFGSRVDDTKRGGDIDLLIISEVIDYPIKNQIRIRLYDLLGEQKIDLLVSNDLDDPFVKLALQSGIEL